ncbi:hypothetical protein F5Y06DRAFT_273248 [Hypoxylon sp. FL0890]|nr:hypothetical protein F5Y06DRAFT_273248 [Hypoxylon sp. FL0890]
MMVQANRETPAKCHNPSCKKGSSNDLLFCSACKKVRYCSQNCQKQNWKDHKSFCKHVKSNGASSASLDWAAYYEKIAAYDPEVQALAREIRLALPSSESYEGVKVPMRRLVVTGKDTPENLTLFFGQDKSVSDVHRDMRLEILLRPPPGSPSDVRARMMKLDQNCPPWTPREASEAEAKEVEKVIAMQETIRRHMGSRGVREVTSNDMRDILVNNFGNQWSEMLHTYQTAVNSMDRGVRPPGIYD